MAAEKSRNMGSRNKDILPQRAQRSQRKAFSLFTNKTIALLWKTDKEDSLRACVSECDDRQDPDVKHKN
ncbi:MAG: hypothetical protein V3V77_03405, partial [Candidatus Bipolaricaulota bacterium]